MNAVSKKSAIIIVFIGVLVLVAVIVVPAWRNHQVRERVFDALSVADTAKLVVMESATIHGGLSHIEFNDLSYNANAPLSEYVAQITIDAHGRIHLTTQGTGATPDLMLLLTPSEPAADNGMTTIQWSCQVVAGDPDLAPHDCRAKKPATATSSSPTNTASIASASSAHSL